jgi:cobyrinic acid a,c-diamide synthase
MKTNVPRIVIAATGSGSGKTTIVTGLLAALKKRSLAVQSYKVGPDYIDPGFHKLASGRAAHNLDTWLVGEDRLTDIFSNTAKNADIAVIEGVMGLYDGGKGGISSTAEIAKELNAPVLLVIDCKSMGDSAAAIALGFREYDKSVNLAGVILNRLGSPSHEAMIVEAMRRQGIAVFGRVRRDDAMHLPERHLGLTPTTENSAEDTVKIISSAIDRQLDIDKIIALAGLAGEIGGEFYNNLLSGSPVKLALANDAAFSFYYPESIGVLKSLGAEIVEFSPLDDKALPKNIDGIILGGGFPEMFAVELSANEAMRRAINNAAKSGMPIYAECGGFMYLTAAICDFDGKRFPMAGIIPAECSMGKKLQTVGYIEAEALTENILCQKGDKLRGHEFHFSTMNPMNQSADDFAWAFNFEKKRTKANYKAGFAKGNILASYLHIHFAGNLAAAENLLEKCRAYQKARDGQNE